MSKIVVGRTIGQTYAFAFRRFLPNLGVTWLPFLVLGALGYHFLLPALIGMPIMLKDMAQHRLQYPGTPYLSPGFGSLIGGILFFDLLALLVFPVFAVGITKEALGLRRGPRFVYLSLGKAELLVLGGLFTLLALYIGAVLVFGILAGIAGVVAGIMMAGSSGSQADTANAIAHTVGIVRIAFLVFYLVFFYFMARLAFLMVPVSVAERRFGVWQSWRLTKGNFWRVVGIVLATFLPLTILSYALWFAAFGSGLFTFMWNAQANPNLANAELAGQMQIIVHYAAYFWALGLALSPLWYGLLFGQSAFAYRTLVPEANANPGA